MKPLSAWIDHTPVVYDTITPRWHRVAGVLALVAALGQVAAIVVGLVWRPIIDYCGSSVRAPASFAVVISFFATVLAVIVFLALVFGRRKRSRWRSRGVVIAGISILVGVGVYLWVALSRPWFCF